jgi:hypothetical protein
MVLIVMIQTRRLVEGMRTERNPKFHCSDRVGASNVRSSMTWATESLNVVRVAGEWVTRMPSGWVSAPNVSASCASTSSRVSGRESCLKFGTLDIR